MRGLAQRRPSTIFRSYGVNRGAEKDIYRRVSDSSEISTWFPCSSVGTYTICIPTLEHGNEETEIEIGIEIDPFHGPAFRYRFP